MIHQVIYPSPTLKRYVRYFWGLRSDQRNDPYFRIDTFVDDSSGFIFIQSGSPVLHVNGNFLPNAFFHGQFTFPTVTKSIGPFSVIGVVLRPTAFKELFGIDAHEMTNRITPCEQIMCGHIVREILDTVCQQQQLSVLSRYLHSRTLNAGWQDWLIKNCLQQIENVKGLITVRELTLLNNISERQLEKRFHTSVGISPRHLIKVARFNSAIEIIRKGKQGSVTSLAHSLDYTDNAHFTRHVKQLSGFTPKELFNKLMGRPADQLFHAT
jgi:AraC-like DNA-binding protein